MRDTQPVPVFAAPGLTEYEHARDVVSAVAQHTPMEDSHFLGDVLGSTVHLKCENLQRTG